MHDYLITRGLNLALKCPLPQTRTSRSTEIIIRTRFLAKIPTNYLIQLSYSYYSKRPFASDSRLSALPKGFFHGTTVLDIGCNEGWVTCEIGDHLPPSPQPANLHSLCESKPNRTAPAE